jgi:hypothetical protein
MDVLVGGATALQHNVEVQWKPSLDLIIERINLIHRNIMDPEIKGPVTIVEALSAMFGVIRGCDDARHSCYLSIAVIHNHSCNGHGDGGVLESCV